MSVDVVWGIQDEGPPAPYTGAVGRIWCDHAGSTGSASDSRVEVSFVDGGAVSLVTMTTDITDEGGSPPLEFGPVPRTER